MGKGHVNQRRKEVGNLWLSGRVNEIIKENKQAPVRHSREGSEEFEVYRPKPGRRNKIVSD
jgi:hypothetical protein